MRHLISAGAAALLLAAVASPSLAAPDPAPAIAAPRAYASDHAGVFMGKKVAYRTTLQETILKGANGQPAASLFSFSYVAKGAKADRPVVFAFNGGPGSSSVFVLLGSFAPRRIKTSMPSFTPPAPYTMEDNPDSLLDESDLVFINPVGTGYSAAVAPRRNREFWGVDQDADSIKQFIKRYLTANDRWNSPKFLFGESYGTARSCVLAYRLHEDGVDLNGVTLQSSMQVRSSARLRMISLRWFL